MKKEVLETMAAYEAPKVEVIEVAVEKGYAQSGDIEGYREGDGWS